MKTEDKQRKYLDKTGVGDSNVVLTSEASGHLWNTCVWDPQSGTSLVTYKGDSAAARTLDILAGEYLITAVNNKPLLHVWALNKKDQIQMRMVCGGQVSALAVSPDGLYCVAAIAEKIHVWQVSTGNLLAVLSRHYQQVNCIKFTDDGSHFVSAGDDSLVLVWSLAQVLSVGGSTSQTAEARFTWSSHSLPVTDLFVGCGGCRGRVATASLDNTCKLWDLASGELICCLVFDASIMSVAMDGGESRLFAGAVNGNIYQVNLFERLVRTERHITSSSEEKGLVFKGHSKQVTCLSVSLDGSLLISGSHDCTVKFWDVNSRQCVRTLPHKGALTNVRLVATPRGVVQGDGKTTVPIQQFKRYLHSGEDREDSNREVVDVRLYKKQRSHDNTEKLDSDEAVGLLAQVAEVSSKHNEQREPDLKDQIKHLKAINRQIYEFAVNEILQSESKKT